MKTTAITLVLLGSVALGAEVAPESTPPATASPAAIQEVVQGAVEQANRVAQDAVGQANRAAQEAVKQAGRAFRLAQSKLSDRLEAPPDAFAVDSESFGPDSFSFAMASPSRTGTQPLIVRTSDVQPGTVANLQEDLSVMSRILNKAVERELGREGRDSAMGIVLSALPGSRRPESIYLEGYGALFFITVKFPLVAPPAKEDEKPEKPSDTTWEQTKRELYGQRTGNVKVWSVPTPEAVEYDADQVEGLKKELLESLKNGANIRDVKAEESLTIAVIGNRASVGTVVHKRTLGGNVRGSEAYVTRGNEVLRPRSRESTMTIRVKKADAEAYSKGAIDFDEFRKRASVSTY